MSLFAFGSNGSGQLGLGHIEDISIPERCHFDSDEANTGSIAREHVVRIAAGGNHTLVLFSNGAVYAAGCNVDRRCGINGIDSVLGFKRVYRVMDCERELHRFKNISATWESSFLVTGYSSRSTDDNYNGNVDGGGDGDMIFALGSGEKGELGLRTGQTQATTPTRIPDFPPPSTRVISIASGMGHTAVVLSTGEVYGWGGARKGQLGEPAKASKIIWSPVKIEGVPFRATDVACGREFTVVSGRKEQGQYMVLGSCDDKWKILSGRPVSLPGYTSISAGWHGIYVYVHRKEDDENGSSPSVTAWGRNDRGQLPPADLPSPKALAVGSEHALALLDERTLVAFGWGEHGNCGPETDAQGNVRGRFNRIQIPSEVGGDNAVIVGVGAGCATSWIITS